MGAGAILGAGASRSQSPSSSTGGGKLDGATEDNALGKPDCEAERGRTVRTLGRSTAEASVLDVSLKGATDRICGWFAKDGFGSESAARLGALCGVVTGSGGDAADAGVGAFGDFEAAGSPCAKGDADFEVERRG
jgi:hypothetical protein